MEFLLVLLVVLGIPFAIGYAVGKGKSSSTSYMQTLREARLQGQAEVRDYIVHFLASQPAQIKKSVLLNVLGVKPSTKTEKVSSMYDVASGKPVAVKGDSGAPSAQTVATNPEPQKPAMATGVSSVGRILSMKKVDQAEKAKKDLQNINTILYVASLLIVAAAVLFVAIDKSVTNELRLFGVWLVTIGFYAAGFMLHKTSQRLRPAAVAFLGTSLALLPFAGLATDYLVLHNPQLSWLINSVLGLVLFFAATLLLKSQLLAYLTIGFVFSLTTSSVAVLQIGFVWYFLLVIIVASLLNFIAYLIPKLLPAVFRKPIDDSGQLAVPLAVFGSWWNIHEVGLWQNAVVLLVTGIHYATASLAPTHLEMRKLYIFLSRLAFSIAVVIFAYDATNDLTAIGVSASIISLIQVAISSTLLLRKNKSGYEYIWLWGGIITLFGSIGFWYDDPHRALLTTISLVTTLIISLTVGFSIRDARFGLAFIIVLALLPLQIGFDLINPHITKLALSLIYIAITTSFLMLRSVWAKKGDIKNVAVGGYIFYIILALCMTSALKAQEASLIFVSAGALLLAISYIERAIYATALANMTLFYGLWLYISTLQINGISRLQLAICVAAALWYIARIVFVKVLRDQDRAQIMAVSSILTLFIGGFAYIGDSGEYGVVASCMLLVAALLISVEGWIYKQYEYYEIAALSVMLAVQRLVAINYDMNILFYVGLWAGLFYGLSILRRIFGGLQAQQFWLVLAVIVLSCYSFAYFLGGDRVLEASLVLFALAAIFANEGRLDKRYEFYEVAAILAMLASQRILSLYYDTDLFVYAVLWATIFYVLALLRRRVGGQQMQQLWYALSVGTMLFYAFIYITQNGTYAWYASFALMLAAAIFANEGRLDKRYILYETAVVLVTISLQKMVSLTGDYDLLLYTHWWALTAAALALGNRQFTKKMESAKVLYIAALCVLTVPTGLKALDNPSAYQLIFLAENIILLVGGLFATHRTTVLWGASGVSLAILYWLKDQTYFLLALVGVGLIGLAIWRLMRLSDKS